MSHDLLWIFGAFAAWIMALEFKLLKSNRKIKKIEQDAHDAKIKSDMHLLSDSKLDALLAVDLGTGGEDH